jgi:hypothetical protein
MYQSKSVLADSDAPSTMKGSATIACPDPLVSFGSLSVAEFAAGEKLASREKS